MPKIKIKEKDLTGAVQASSISNIVYLPIQVTKAFEPTLFGSIKELEAKVKDNIEVTNTVEYKKGLGYRLAKHLINAGFEVLLEGFEATTDTINNNKYAEEAIKNLQKIESKIPEKIDALSASSDKYASIALPQLDENITSSWEITNEDKNEFESGEAPIVISNGNLTINKDKFLADKKLVAYAEVTVTSHKTQVAVKKYKFIFPKSAEITSRAIEITVESTSTPAINVVPNANWEALKDKGLYDIRFLTNGAFVGKIPQQMIDVAAYRGDCVALVNLDETATGFDYTPATVNEKFNLTNGEYAAGFIPAFTMNSFDFDNDDIIPAAFGYLFAYANSIKNNPEYLSIAGFERGIIPGLKTVLHEYGSAEIDALQKRTELDADDDNVGVAVNPIANIRPAGYIIYGNRTLRANDATKKLIASSFLNVRNGVSAIKKKMYDASRQYTFEQNTVKLWNNFQSLITPLLDDMVSGGGLEGYRFTKLKTNAKARLKARLTIIPVEAVEDFDLEVILSDSLDVNE